MHVQARSCYTEKCAKSMCLQLEVLENEIYFLAHKNRGL